MLSFGSVVLLGLIILVVDAAAIIELTQNQEPDFVLAIGFLILSIPGLGVLPFLYKRLKKEENKPKGRF